jgi:hypothetical protein
MLISTPAKQPAQNSLAYFGKLSLAAFRDAAQSFSDYLIRVIATDMDGPWVTQSPQYCVPALITTLSWTIEYEPTLTPVPSGARREKIALG